MSDQSAFVLDESGKLLVEPHMEELPELFVSYFKEILRVGYEIPRLEYYMSQGKQRKIDPKKCNRFSVKRIDYAERNTIIDFLISYIGIITKFVFKMEFAVVGHYSSKHINSI